MPDQKKERCWRRGFSFRCKQYICGNYNNPSSGTTLGRLEIMGGALSIASRPEGQESSRARCGVCTALLDETLWAKCYREPLEWFFAPSTFAGRPSLVFLGREVADAGHCKSSPSLSGCVFTVDSDTLRLVGRRPEMFTPHVVVLSSQRELADTVWPTVEPVAGSGTCGDVGVMVKVATGLMSRLESIEPSGWIAGTTTGGVAVVEEHQSYSVTDVSDLVSMLLRAAQKPTA